ncbi:unnamed protein product [Symbiodinium sp. CCMP2592]|nr:unnamed protein product [Symbiodinium sp. CCMP2592]
MVRSLWYLILWCLKSPISESNLADPRGMLAVELSTTRKLLLDSSNNSKNGHIFLRAVDDMWAVVRELGTAVASDVGEEGLATIRDLASLRALTDIGFLETALIPLLGNARQANLTPRVSTDLRWLMKLLPRGDRSAVALGHVVLTWVMLNSLRADSDGFVRMESASSITQAFWLSQQTASVTVRQICEVGFNGGHSAWAMLSSTLSHQSRIGERVELSAQFDCQNVVGGECRPAPYMLQMVQVPVMGNSGGTQFSNGQVDPRSMPVGFSQQAFYGRVPGADTDRNDTGVGNRTMNAGFKYPGDSIVMVAGQYREVRPVLGQATAPGRFHCEPAELPLGLQLDPSTGTIWGTPASPPAGMDPAGPYQQFTVVLTNAAGATSCSIGIKVVQFNPQSFSISHISQLEKSKYMVLVDTRRK